MPLQELCCTVTRVRDLSPLKDAPLIRLDIYHTAICDLTPLSQTPLRWLNCNATAISSLAPLRGTPLEALHCDASLLAGHAAMLRGMSTLVTVNGKPAAEVLQAFAASAPAAAAAVPVPVVTSVKAAPPPEQQLAGVITRLRQLNPGFDGRETHKIENGAVTELAFSTLVVRDLSPLRDLGGLRRLNLSPWPGQAGRGVLADLSPLKGMALTTLNCANTQVSSLLPLYGMKLESLQCNNTAISDLLALDEMPLKALNCSGTRVTDLLPLAALSLKELQCDFDADRDSVLLRGIKTLEKINGLPAAAFWMRLNAMRPTRPKSPSAAAAAARPVDDAFIRFIGVLPPEKQAVRVMDKLRSLNRGFVGEETHTVSGGKVTQIGITVTAGLGDLSPLVALTGLSKFECVVNSAECPVIDLRPLRGLPLVELTLRRLAVNDLSPLSGMPLEILSLDSCRITDISAVKGMRLKRLSLWASPVASLEPVAGMPLEWLNCTGTKIRDLAPLKGAPLKELFCDEAAVLDLSPLADLPLRTLRCDPSAVRAHAKTLAALPSLTRINNQPAAEFLSGFQAGK
jgi:hypothetical protein